MCGIAGFADAGWQGRTNGQAQARLESEFALVHRMCDVIRHRGPDDEGIHVEPGVGLGMRRLSIIDLAGGHQPIHNEDRSVWIVFNGEIYNYLELRAELEKRGHRFATNSDTESIVHAYEEWGEDAFERLRGMFGLAIWDRPRRTLMLARDRAGIKPLHYVERNGRVVFASEIKSLLARRRGEPRAGSQRARSLPRVSLYPARSSIFKGVRKAPARALPALARGTRRRPALLAGRRHGDVPRKRSRGGGRLAERARRSRSVAPGQRCAARRLSFRGVDSSAVVGLMAHASSRPVQTFSIGFDEPDFDELEHARTVARHFGTDHHELIVRPDGLAILDRLVGHFDEPFADSSAIPTWYVSEMARRHVTVVLSGDGGDELFGGYDRYLPHPGSPGSIACRCPACAPPPARSGRCCRMASAAGTSCVMWVEATRDATSTRSRCSRPTSAPHSIRLTCERGWPSMPKPPSPDVSSGSRPCRCAAA